MTKLNIEETTTKLTMAIRLIDDFTKGEVIGSVKVLIEGKEKGAIKNLSGYYLFMDLPIATYKIVVKTDFYLIESMEINTSAHDSSIPIEIRLKPNSTYPFPIG